ncbi:MAG: hypothetical protein C4563_02470 [Desulfobulbus sp.]|jgi:hypothetical protein|nr:MAG: hypothetical protein C4563_02470 [Desulfobulbus sp.]
MNEVVYTIDAGDRLFSANDAWDRFASENSSPHLNANTVCHRLLWDFIQDSETCLLHATLLGRVRSGRSIRNLPFRCDSPGLRRFMEMDITDLGDGIIEYRCRLIKTEVREPVPLLADSVRADERLLRMCSWCKKIDAGNNVWLEIEDFILRRNLFAAQPIPRITHTICDTCVKLLDDQT